MQKKIEVHAEIETFPRERPFRIKGMVWTEHRCVTVRIRSEELSGWGECCGVFYRNETEERIFAEIELARQGIESGADRNALLELLPPGAARNALDCALWDLEAKRAGRPVWQLVGLEPPRPLLTTYTIGAEDPSAMANRAVWFSAARALKLKLLGDELDAERVRAVRAARPDVWLGVDANQGYSLGALERLIPTLVSVDCQLIEQPLPVGNEKEVAGLRSPIPVAADESILDLEDLDRVTGFEVVNLKLDKSGGLTRCLQIAREARRRGFQVMVGCMGGSSLAMAPGFVLGQLCTIVDLDGPTDLLRDRPSPVTYINGEICCADELWGGAR